MWIRYTSTVSIISLAVAYAATLLVGWSLARQVPGVRDTEQLSLLAYGAAVAIIAWPVWFLHWRWAKRDWLWESDRAQYHLMIFTVIGLIASAIIGAQFIARFFEVLLGARTLNNDTTGFLLGALWSTVFSVWLWVYHGSTWVQHRRSTRQAQRP
jgi:CDP-diglyceride synthetase